MVMDTVQVRLTRGLVKEANALVAEGRYANRSEVVRDALRQFLWTREIAKLRGIAKLSRGKTSVGLVRELRRKMSPKTPLKVLNRE